MTGAENPPPSNFRKLVIGCIEAKFCEKILVGKLSPKSTQCPPLHRSPVSIFSFLKIAKFCKLLQNNHLIMLNFAEILLDLPNFFGNFVYEVAGIFGKI